MTVLIIVGVMIYLFIGAFLAGYYSSHFDDSVGIVWVLFWPLLFMAVFGDWVDTQVREYKKKRNKEEK